MKNSTGDFSIYVEDMTDGEKYTLRSNDTFPAASLYKIYLMAATLKAVEDGDLRLTDHISATKSYLTDALGDEDFGYEESGENITYSVGEALERVGRISDNFAAIMLAEKIGWDRIQEMVDSLGANHTTIKSPISTSSSDIAQFFKSLYKKEVVSPSVSDQINELLALGKINDRIPAKITDDIKIVHKTGELPGIRHDAGIVYLPNGRSYVIVLMSQNLQYEDEGVETLANISQDVYEYFKNKGRSP